MTIEQQLSTLSSPAPARVTAGVMLGTGLVDGCSVFDSPIGEVMVAFNPLGVSAVDLADDGAPGRFEATHGRPVVEARPPRGWDAAIRRAIDRGTPGTLRLDLRSVSEFQRSVLVEAAHIPRGQVRSYGWLADHVGNPGAVRAVGSTMARNPVPLIIPCHRVVRSDGRIGNYSLGGPHRKWELLEHEGIDPGWLEGLAARRVRFVGSDTTRVYCHPSCAHARRITATHRMEFRSADEALDRGFRPCASCMA